jgi:4-hydroxybenzoate polyprenyltransferase
MTSSSAQVAQLLPAGAGAPPHATWTRGALRGWVASMRPAQWAKNVFLFAGIAFAGKLTDPHSVVLALGAFVVFCALSSAAYLINDVRDIAGDRVHPRKSGRPIASGVVPPRGALALAAVLALGGVAGSWTINWGFGLCALGYLALSLAYTLGLKHVLFVDVIALSVFYVLRAAAGAIAISVVVSPWLLLCTTLLALFIGVTKRRHELLVLGDAAGEHRRSLLEYSAPLLDQMVGLLSSAVLISYALYTFFSNHPHKSVLLVATFPFVVYALFRFLYLTYRKQEIGSPEELILTDRPLALCVSLWGLVAVAVMYWK